MSVYILYIYADGEEGDYASLILIRSKMYMHKRREGKRDAAPFYNQICRNLYVQV